MKGKTRVNSGNKNVRLSAGTQKQKVSIKDTARRIRP